MEHGSIWQPLRGYVRSGLGVAIITLSATFIIERMQLFSTARSSSPLLAFGAGATSGFSGSVGPLKGIALRNMEFDRRYMVGAVSAVSLAGDAMKATIFTQNALLDSTPWLIVLCALPLMPLATLNRTSLRRADERSDIHGSVLVSNGRLSAEVTAGLRSRI